MSGKDLSLVSVHDRQLGKGQSVRALPDPSLYSNHYEEGTGLIEDFRERFNPMFLLDQHPTKDFRLFRIRRARTSLSLLGGAE